MHDIATEHPGSAHNPRRLPWELVEIAGGALLISAVAIGVFSLASGIAYSYSTVNDEGAPFSVGPSLTEITQRSTAWASTFVALMVLAVLGAVWWQVESTASLAADSGDRPASEDNRRSVSVLRRARGMTTVVIAYLVVLAAAVVTQIVTIFQLYASAPAGVAVSQYLDDVGQGVATLLLIGGAAVVGLRLRRSIDERLVATEPDVGADHGGQIAYPLPE